MRGARFSTAARLALAGGVVVLALLAWWLDGAGTVSPGSPGSPVSPGSPGSRSGPVAASSSGSAASGPVAASPGAVGPASLPGAQAPLRTKALAVLQVVDATGVAPRGYVGGRPFQNDGRGGTAPLPRRDPAGRAVSYHEYDVNPYRSGVNRGPQRLVVGTDGSAWCTGDHYVTWQRLR